MLKSMWEGGWRRGVYREYGWLIKLLDVKINVGRGVYREYGWLIKLLDVKITPIVVYACKYH